MQYIDIGVNDLQSFFTSLSVNKMNALFINNGCYFTVKRCVLSDLSLRIAREYCLFDKSIFLNLVEACGGVRQSQKTQRNAAAFVKR